MIPIGQWLSARRMDPPWPGPPAIAIEVELAPGPAAASATSRDIALEEIRAEFAARLEAERESAAATLAEARAQWVEHQSAAISRSLSEAVTALEDKLATAVAGILERLMPHAVAAMALTDFRSMLKQLLASEPKSLRLAAPSDMIEAVRADFAGAGLAIELVVSDGYELQAVAEATSIETRIGAWLETIGGAAA
ncbi:MAG: hypothetical protein HY245_04965 [Rhizobiales bacterium]|nr:hypothetical protein [Hyphomicrobiales bacterium]MBI3672765.1 hypothetical protein [Hyphomicrobiales bacterium]